ncbi:MAG: manganese efflux pump MntP family protein [Candidatus Eremiobacteraeota bacterium]|nr:manganese efflux pump MntP family protein [Candidatus Eremiobacteraeota bacterium]
MILKIALFVLPLGLDTFAIAVAVGLRRIHPLRPAAVFAIAEGTMPLVGIFFGSLVSLRFQSAAGYIGAVILILLGLHVLKESEETLEEAEGLSFTSLRTMLLAGLAVSIDEIAIGFPLATEGLPVLWVLVAIAAQAFLLGYAGVSLGAKLGARASKLSGILAGCAFIALGIWLIVSRLAVR